MADDWWFNDSLLSHFSGWGLVKDSEPHDEAAEQRASVRLALFSSLLKGELEDLAKPPGARRTGDTYSGQHGFVCDQLLMDAHRAEYYVAGSKVKLGAGEICCDFAERLVVAMQRCLGLDTNPEGSCEPNRLILARMTTMLLSQAGMALLDTSCLETTVALCGGERCVSYELVGLGSDAWELRGVFIAEGFREFFEVGAGADAPQKCSPKSSMTRSFVVRLALDDEAPFGVAVDVRMITNDVALLDLTGSPLKLEGDARMRSYPRDGDHFGHDEGTEEHYVSEWKRLWLAPIPRVEDIVSAWFGHSTDPTRRKNITNDVVLLAANAAKKEKEGNGATSEMSASGMPGLSIPAMSWHWGDPAPFTLKRLSVTLRKRKDADTQGVASYRSSPMLVEQDFHKDAFWDDGLDGLEVRI
eukprot:TRINITY_DN61616_c0_g1_i1.p1 TRINITY_DN61616_c0_g1~~TRINITY_DN61616_c0_g1_i1.p1  ORF type:complete len:414 (-),score=80.56 TRINITY_DN61616_c0_g1_i1:83-1324(-)